MNTRSTLILALAAGLPAAASAQEAFHVFYSWEEVIAGSTTPVANPNGVVEPGEAARIRLGVSALINGTNAVGQNTTYTNPQPGGIGTVKGMASCVYDLVGDNNAATAYGTWGGFIGGMVGHSGTGAPFGNPTVPPSGTVQPGGASVHGFGGSQFIASGPGVTANGTNNNVQILRGVWRPSEYSQRTVTFVARASVLVPVGEHNSVLFAYGIGTDPVTGEKFDLYAAKYFGSSFGSGVNIPIAPSPSCLSLVGLIALLGSRRRRKCRSDF